MQSGLKLSLAAGAALLFLQAPVHAQGTAAISGQVTSEAEGAMEGVVVTARKAMRTSRSAWSPMRKAATTSRPTGSSPANIRSQSARSAMTSAARRPQRRGREDGDCRHQAREDQEARRASSQRGMDGEHSRHRGPEIHVCSNCVGLPHPRARRALHP